MRKNVVVFTAFNKAPDEISDYVKVCFESWKRWALKHNVEVVVIEDPLFSTQEMKPTWQRWYFLNLLNESGYRKAEKIALVDVDTLIHPDAPNFFDLLTDEYDIAVVQDDTMVEWTLNSINGYQKFFSSDELNWTEYFNCGFVVLRNNETCTDFCDSIYTFYNRHKQELQELQHRTLRKGSDQTPVNYFVKHLGMRRKFLDKRWNFTHLHTRGLLTEQGVKVLPQAAYVYHFNGFEKKERYNVMSFVWSLINQSI